LFVQTGQNNEEPCDQETVGRVRTCHKEEEEEEEEEEERCPTFCLLISAP
jgi:hypothetical protein